MRRGVDTNVLLTAHVPVLAAHGEVRTFLQRQLADPDVTLAVTPIVMHELVHIITDPRRFDPSASMSEAIALARRYLGRTNVECLPVDVDSLDLALALLDHHRLGRKRIADALLAATLLTHGVSERITCNPGDFVVFEGLRVTDPPAGAPPKA